MSALDDKLIRHAIDTTEFSLEDITTPEGIIALCEAMSAELAHVFRKLEENDSIEIKFCTIKEKYRGAFGYFIVQKKVS